MWAPLPPRLDMRLVSVACISSPQTDLFRSCELAFPVGKTKIDLDTVSGCLPEPGLLSHGHYFARLVSPWKSSAAPPD